MTTRKLQRPMTMAATLVVALAAVSACSSSSDSTSSDTSHGGTAAEVAAVTVDGVWARPAAVGANTAVYFTIHGGASDDVLVVASADPDLADTVAMHETTTADAANDDSVPADGHGSTVADDDPHMPMTTGGHMKTMQPVDSVDVPAGGTVEFAPGGYHVMFEGLHRELKVGDQVPVTLKFEKAGDLEVTAEVREM